MFADPGEAIEFIDLLWELKLRDGFQAFAWSLLSNHYHLVVRVSAVPLARTMGTASGEDRRTAGEAPRMWSVAGRERERRGGQRIRCLQRRSMSWILSLRSQRVDDGSEPKSSESSDLAPMTRKHLRKEGNRKCP